MNALPYRKLGNTGLSVSEFSFGCAGMAGMYQACPEDRAMATMAAAWNAGMRYFDTAPFYGTGPPEQRLGRFPARKPPGDYVVSSKVGRLLTPVPQGPAPDCGFVGGLPARVHFDYSHDAILRSVETSLARLGLDRIGILYVHNIGDFAHGPQEGARHMADLSESGLAALDRLNGEGVIQAWGLGVNEVEVCLEVTHRTQPVAILLAGRCALLDRRAEAVLVPLCRARGVSLVVGGVLNCGILATGAVPGAKFNYAPAAPDIRDGDDGIELVCRGAGCGLLAAALQFPLAEPVVASAFVGCADPQSLIGNMAAAQVRIAPEVHVSARRFWIEGPQSDPLQAECPLRIRNWSRTQRSNAERRRRPSGRQTFPLAVSFRAAPVDNGGNWPGDCAIRPIVGSAQAVLRRRGGKSCGGFATMPPMMAG